MSFERDIEDHLVNSLESIETGLKLISRQDNTEVGRIDLVAQDQDARSVVIEIKVVEAKDSAIGQIARYLGWFARQDGQAPRGILIAGDFPDGVEVCCFNSAQSDSALIQSSFHFRGREYMSL